MKTAIKTLSAILLISGMIKTMDHHPSQQKIENIDNLSVSVTNFDPTITVMQYNVNNALITERDEKTKWNNRYPRVLKMIEESNPDIICLEELREVENTIPVKQFLALLKSHESIVWRSNAAKTSFSQAILYKADMHFPTQSFPLWLSDTPEEISDTWTKNDKNAWGAIVLCARFLPIVAHKIVKNVPGFWVFNTHFGMEEESKTKSCLKLLKIIKNVAENEPYILCGDMNTFFDKDGAKQTAILESEMQKLSGNLETLEGKKVKGTFHGDETDAFKAKFPLEDNMTELDYIYGSRNIEKIGNTIVYTKTMLPEEPKELSTRDYPSDHQAILVKLKLYKSIQQMSS